MNKSALILLLFLLSSVLPCLRAESGWEELARYQFVRADEILSRPGNAEPGAALARAVCLLQRQPKTQANLEEAKTILTGILSAEKDVDLIAMARFLRARIACWHESQPDFDLAERLLEEVRREHKGHFMAQLALLDLATLRLMRPTDKAAAQAAFDSMEPLSTEISEPCLLRNYHRLLAEAVLMQKLDHKRAIPHLREALRIGFDYEETQRDMLLRLGRLTAEAGLREEATEAYGRFVKEFPGEKRAAWVRDQLARLEKGSP